MIQTIGIVPFIIIVTALAVAALFAGWMTTILKRLRREGWESEHQECQGMMDLLEERAREQKHESLDSHPNDNED